MRRAFVAVALLALVCLLPRAARVGMAGDYIDPIGKITAQDEALYGHSAIAMARGGDWLTPHFMGRLALYKPPMAIWLAALSARVFGIEPLTLRLPLMAIAALAVALLFLWGAEAAGVTAGACAALLLLSNHLFHTLAALCMTDALLLAFTAAAVYALYADPWLESRAALGGFAAATAGAILSKGIAGFLPLAVLGLYCIVVRSKERPAVGRALLAAGLALALTAPWFLYQLAAHPRWFWTEHIAVEILGFGTGAPPQTSRENPVAFYLLRLAATDPILFSGVIVAIPAFARALRGRKAGPTLIACWLGLTAATTLAWQYRNASYLLALVPPLALMAACYGPFAEQRHSSWMLGFLCVGLVLKAALPDAPWGLNYRAGTVNPVAPALSKYCEGPRSSELIVVELADDLYASLLPVRLRYASASAGAVPASGPYLMPFRELGIILTVEEFTRGESGGERFAARLREWGVDSTAPVGTLIAAASAKELEALVRATPRTDFLIPERYRDLIADPGHRWAPAAPGYGFLLARDAGGSAPLPAAWTCHM